jgi:hypothetical protein
MIVGSTGGHDEALLGIVEAFVLDACRGLCVLEVCRDLCSGARVFGAQVMPSLLEA